MLQVGAQVPILAWQALFPLSHVPIPCVCVLRQFPPIAQAGVEFIAVLPFQPPSTGIPHQAQEHLWLLRQRNNVN